MWGCISSKGVGQIRILDEIMAKEVYLDILKNELIPSIKKFGFIDPVNKNKFYTNTIKVMILNINLICVCPACCTIVINTHVEKPDINLWVGKGRKNIAKK